MPFAKQGNVNKHEHERMATLTPRHCLSDGALPEVWRVNHQWGATSAGDSDDERAPKAKPKASPKKGAGEIQKEAQRDHEAKKKKEGNARLLDF